MAGFVGVHVGAGHHSECHQIQYEALCRKAARKGYAVLRSGGSPLLAASMAVQVLEDSEDTNAGFGSNLTYDETVECDASVMDGKTLHYGAVGAVSGVKNPVDLARSICEAQATSLPMGRISPVLLVGEGAHSWAVEHGVPTVDPKSMISDAALKKCRKCKDKYEKASKKAMHLINQAQDTVGAVCVDSLGHVAAASSSGGILIKRTGRVGQCGSFGGGVWAEDATGRGKASAAVATSGCGEQLIRTCLARELGRYLALSEEYAHSIVHRVVNASFLKSPFALPHLSLSLGGVIALQCEKNKCRGEFVWAHTTKSIIVGYVDSNNTKGISHTSRLPTHISEGSTVAIGGIRF